MASAQSTTKPKTGSIIPVKKPPPFTKGSSGIPVREDLNLLRSEYSQTEKRLRAVEKHKLKLEKDLVNRELSDTALYISQKNKILGLLRKHFNREFRHKSTLSKSDAFAILNRVDESIRFDNDWFYVKAHFELIHPGYFDRLRKKFPRLTPTDHKLCALLRMNLNTKEIAEILKITAPSTEISRIRLRKKLNLDKTVNLTQYISRI